MKKYIGVKIIEAKPMIAEKAGEILNRPIDTSNADSEGNGYLVKYPEGYTSWSPKKPFEKAYMQIGDNNTITKDNVDNFIKETEVMTLGKKSTVVKATLVNDFVIVDSSSCVDPANYDEKMGAEICLEHIKDKVWNLLGFLLQTAKSGIKGGN